MKNRKTKYLNRNEKIALIAALLLTPVLFFYLQHRQDQEKKAARLDKASQALSEINAFVPKNTDGQWPHSSCYKTSVKFSSGWRVCEEKLEIIAINRSDDEILAETAKFVKNMNESGIFEKINADEFARFTDNQQISVTEPLRAISNDMPSCRLDYRAYSVKHHLLNNKGTYNLEISCFESHLDKNIFE